MPREFEQMDYTLAIEAADAELHRALDLFPPMASAHEGHSVIREEFEELWELVKKNKGDSPDAFQEAIQLAAMAIRYAAEIAS